MKPADFRSAWRQGVTTPIEELRALARAASERPLAEDEFGNIGPFIPPFNIIPPERYNRLDRWPERRAERRNPLVLGEGAGQIGIRLEDGFAMMG